MCEKLNMHKIQGVYEIRGHILDSFSIEQIKEENSCKRVSDCAVFLRYYHFKY
jgi:hypothetical protein